MKVVRFSENAYRNCLPLRETLVQEQQKVYTSKKECAVASLNIRFYKIRLPQIKTFILQNVVVQVQLED